jgi:hypothetical protein
VEGNGGSVFDWPKACTAVLQMLHSRFRVCATRQIINTSKTSIWSGTALTTLTGLPTGSPGQTGTIVFALFSVRYVHDSSGWERRDANMQCHVEVELGWTSTRETTSCDRTSTVPRYEAPALPDSLRSHMNAATRLKGGRGGTSVSLKYNIGY